VSATVSGENPALSFRFRCKGIGLLCRDSSDSTPLVTGVARVQTPVTSIIKIPIEPIRLFTINKPASRLMVFG
jgi:hypothetical protein